jgi:hypothetical protein
MGTAASNEVSGGFAHGYNPSPGRQQGEHLLPSQSAQGRIPHHLEDIPSKDEAAAWAAETESSLGNSATKRTLLSSKTSMADLIDR